MQIAHVAKGIRDELLNAPIKASSVIPRYIRTELNAGAKRLSFEISEEVSCKGSVPGWPWTLMGALMQILPLRWRVRLN
jgi:hypothetical protein